MRIGNELVLLIILFFNLLFTIIGDPNIRGKNESTNDIIYDKEESLDILKTEVKDAMKTLLRTRTLRGCPINIAFTDVEEVLSKVKSIIY